MAVSLREKILGGRLVVGPWISIPDVAVVEILAQAGIDYLLIDGEHAPINPSQLVPLALAAERRGCPIVDRVQANRADLIKALEGTQPVFKQSPPILCFSMRVTFALTAAAM